MSDILHGSTNKTLISMSLPISIGMLSTFLFQVIDTYFVGQLGPEALTALSFASTVYFLLVGLFIGLSVGVSILIGQAAGAGDIGLVKKATRIALFICLLLSLVIAAAVILLVDPIFTAFGAEEEILPLIREYIVPLMAGTPLLTLGLLAGGILRATGNVTKPEVIMGIAGVINLVFDYALIFGKWGLPELGIQGAAYATVLSWVFVILGMLFLLLRDKLLDLTAKSARSFGDILKQIGKLAAPTVVPQIMGPFTMMYLTILLARQSSAAVAAFGVAGRIEMLLLIGILGVSTAITPFIAQNAGAQQQKRIDAAIAFGGRASTYLGLLVAIVLVLFIKPIAGLFSADGAVIDNTSIYFYCIAFSYVFYGLYLITTSIYNGLALPVNSLRISLFKTLAFTVPLTLLGSIWGTTGIFLGVAASNVLAGFYSSYEMRKTFRKADSDLAHVNVWHEYGKDLRMVLRLGRKGSS